MTYLHTAINGFNAEAGVPQVLPLVAQDGSKMLQDVTVLFNGGRGIDIINACG